MIENIQIKIIFDSGAEVNYMFKRLTDAVQLSIRQNINIIIINVTDERARFFDVCETVFINIDSITICQIKFNLNLNHICINYA